ncbi:SPRY-domain-containing protein [Meredithblackwellia eburnea MCA 4105]
MAPADTARSVILQVLNYSSNNNNPNQWSLNGDGDDDGEGDGPDQTGEWPLPEQPSPTGGRGHSQPLPPGTGTGTEDDDSLAILLPLLLLLTSLLFLLLLFLVFLVFLRRKRGVALRDDSGPTNLEREDDVDGEGGLAGVEQRWLEETEENTRAGYLRGKVWQSQYPPNSLPTDITLSQFLSIQEKGVSAWSFEPDYESNPALIVQSRTEITFLSDGVGMAEEEGGGCCVQSNLPLPKLNEVYYWECKFFEKPETTLVSIGLATKPYPSFRLPGVSKYSIGYFSSDGFKSHSYPFNAQSYGPPLKEGDVLGVGYRPRTGTVFFTRNGKKLEDAYVGLTRHNLFPTVGANAACTIHVNLGQAGFVFIEANVKKWGLAPMMGTLAPPPAYGSERGSILLESAAASHSNNTLPNGRVTVTPPTPPTARSSSSNSAGPSSRRHHHKHRRGPSGSSSNSPGSSSSGVTAPPLVPFSTTAAGAVSALASTSGLNQPARPSPLRHSRQASTLSARSAGSGSGSGSASSRGGAGSDGEDEEGLQNPPTPGLFDVSLHSLHRFPQEEDEEEGDDEDGSSSRSGSSRSVSPSEEGRSGRGGAMSQPSHGRSTSPAPPAYFPVDPNMYPAGVAELMLSDVFGAAASSPSSGGGGGGGGGASGGRTSHGQQQQQLYQSTIAAQQAAAMMAQFQASGSGFSEGRYEGGVAGSSPASSTGAGRQTRGGSSGGGGWWPSSWFASSGASSSAAGSADQQRGSSAV